MIQVQLGFIDEPITHYDQIHYTINKLGGYPDWLEIGNTNKKVICNICNSITPLLLQIYAPIVERFKDHRTLYVFACINPSCWGNPKSWRCLKSQSIAKDVIEITATSSTNFSSSDWSSEADNWGCDESYTGNNISWGQKEAAALIQRVSIDEENANEVPDIAFMEAIGSVPSAEIEPDENEPITVDSPILPNCNLVNLLKQKPSSSKITNGSISFSPWFICSFEEQLDKDPLSEHVQNLISEYTRHSDHRNSPKGINNVNVHQQSDEKYEKSQPAHGDKLFYSFMSRIKTNPEQILRYCRSNAAPLFLYPESDIPKICNGCKGEMIFEMQILPTVINYLKLSGENRKHRDHLEFGSAFVYTCKTSCDNSEEEFVLVQSEQF